MCLCCFDRMQRKVLHQFVMMAKRQMPSRIGGHTTDAKDKAAQGGSKRLSWLFLMTNAKVLFRGMSNFQNRLL